MLRLRVHHVVIGPKQYNNNINKLFILFSFIYILFVCLNETQITILYICLSKII